MTDSAQLFHGIHDTPVYTDFLFRKPLRLWVAAPAALGLTVTFVLTVRMLDSGHARAVLMAGLALTGLAAGLGAILPTGRPGLGFRAAAVWRTVRPQLRRSSADGLISPPEKVIGNLRFTKHGVYADFLVVGLRYYLQSTKRRTGVADRHRDLARELPSGSWLYGLSVPQDDRQLLRAMMHGHRDRLEWARACQMLEPLLTENRPRTRVYWLSIPVDAGRGGHSPVGQATKLKDWLAGRDKDSESSLEAYQRLAYDIISALPEEFAPTPVTEDMIDWFWKRNAFRGVFDQPLPQLRSVSTDPAGRFVATEFDDGDQAHRPQRPALLSWLPSWKRVLRTSSPDEMLPDSYQAILPVVDMPREGIAFPGSEFLDALDDLDTGAVFDFAISLQMRSRETEFIRNDRAKGNLSDQFEQRRDVRNGDHELSTTWRQLAEYNRLLTASVDERPLEAAFLIGVGAPDTATLDYSIKRLREELTNSGHIVIRHYRGAQTRLWAAFNPGAPLHRSGVAQFAYPTTTGKWSRFVPLTSSAVGNTTGILLGFNQSNALNAAVLLDLPGTATRNHNPVLLCSGAPGYGKSYAAKGITRAEIQRGAQAFIVDPGTEWAAALGDRPNTAVIDMAGNDFGCDPLRVFPPDVAGGYWLDYMLPMMGIDPRSVPAARLRTLLAPDARERLGIHSTAALVDYLASIQAPGNGVDTRPPQVAALADELRGVLVSLQSWATHDFTRAIFDPTLPIPDLASLDVSIWLTGSLDLPTAEEMATPHLYNSLSERKLASVAIYGMLVRLARLAFFANRERFGLIVLEEAGGLLNSRAGADDCHLISRRARKHFTGLLLITQDPVADLALMGDQFITQQLIMPFEDEPLARKVVSLAGIRIEDYPDIEEYFLAQPAVEQMRDPTAFDAEDFTGDAATPQRGDREGFGFFVDEFRRPAPIRVIRQPDPAIHSAFDTTPGAA
ncbi:MAG: ATP-binding protein [Mycobacterium sp.]|nr:ATP-binding protein [Mycobacterium sp.]